MKIVEALTPEKQCLVRSKVSRGINASLCGGPSPQNQYNLGNTNIKPCSKADLKQRATPQPKTNIRHFGADSKIPPTSLVFPGDTLEEIKSEPRQKEETPHKTKNHPYGVKCTSAANPQSRNRVLKKEDAILRGDTILFFADFYPHSAANPRKPNGDLRCCAISRKKKHTNHTKTHEHSRGNLPNKKKVKLSE